MESQHWDIIRFTGEDTLCLSKFAKNIVDDPASYTPYVVHVQGRYVADNSKVNVLGKLKVHNKNIEYINGFIRNVRIEDIHCKKNNKGLSIGCCNATLEDIAADKVTFFFFGNEFKRRVHIHDRYFGCYSIFPPYVKCTVRDMNQFQKSGDYLRAITVAKRLGMGEKRARLKVKELLMGYLTNNDSDYNAEMKEFTVEAFRSLEKLCEEDEKVSEQTTNALIAYIEHKKNDKDFVNSVIYAIEALGFVGNYHENQKISIFEFLPEFLGSLNRTDFKDKPAMYWHLVWASCVTLNRIMPNERTEKIKKNELQIGIDYMDKSLLDDEVLASINPKEARNFIVPIININKTLLDKAALEEMGTEEIQYVIQKVLAEVVILSRIISLEKYLSLFGLREFDIESIRKKIDQAGTGSKEIPVHYSKNLIESTWKEHRINTSRIVESIAIPIIIGVMKAYLELVIKSN
ncbi:MAG: hypothetical protein JW712_14800 [Dehalococcoidales bacterium]|nr:hypothetical protein [Dehalococcoidales bacterium]